MAKRNFGIVALGGVGKRFLSSTPKQFLKAGNRYLCEYPIKALDDSPSIDAIVLITLKSHFSLLNEIVESMHLKKDYMIVEGGDTRNSSLDRAVFALKGEDPESLCLIVDGDRPNLKQRYIDECIEAAKQSGASIVSRKETDSTFILDGEDMEYLNRNLLYRAETPQCFKLHILEKAYLSTTKRDFTDEASMVLKQLGIKPSIVLSDGDNIKINTPSDLEIFKATLKQ